jgi:type I restriction enzyme, S subunit
VSEQQFESSNLPYRWRWITFKEATLNFDGQRIPVKKTERAKRSGPYPYYGASGIIDEIDDYLFDGEFLLVAEDGANLLSRSTPIAFRAAQKFWVNNHAHVVQTRDGISQAYLEYFLNSIDLKFHVTGTAQPKLTQANLNKIPVPLAPFSEQLQIVAEIEKQFTRLEAGVAGLRRVQANLKRYRAAVLKSACEGKLVHTEAELARQEGRNFESGAQLLERILTERRQKWNGNGKYKEPPRPATENLPELPVGWAWACLESITEAVGGYAFESKKFCDSGFQVLKMANVRMGRIDLSQRPSFISEVDQEIANKYKLLHGDVVVTLTGSRKKEDYGYVALVKNAESLLLNQRIARLRCIGGILPAFLEIAMQSKDFRKRFFSYETGNVGQGNVGMTAITKESIPLPPLAEQQRVVAEVECRVSVLEELEAVVNSNLQRASRLRQSILQWAFSGRLISEPNGGKYL